LYFSSLSNAVILATVHLKELLKSFGFKKAIKGKMFKHLGFAGTEPLSP